MFDESKAQQILYEWFLQQMTASHPPTGEDLYLKLQKCDGVPDNDRRKAVRFGW